MSAVKERKATSDRKESPIGSYPAHWNLVQFDTIAELVHGYQFRTNDFTDEGVKVFKITQIKDNGTVDVSNCDCIASSRLKDFEKNIIHTGDILMALSGATIGKIARYNKTETVLQNYRVGNFKPLDPKILNKEYFYYFLTSEITYQQILANQTQSAQENVGKDDIHKMLVFLPPIEEQVAIGEILSSLDDKIDLLHRQNKTLEEMTRTLFRKWFVEEADEIWATTKVGEVAAINKKSIGKDFPCVDIEYLDTGSITEGRIESWQKYSLSVAPSRAQRLVEANDIVYSLVRPIHRHYGLIDEAKPNSVVSTGFATISCRNLSPYFVYTMLTLDETVEYLDSIAEGSTSAYPSLRPSDIETFEFQLPPADKLKSFHDLAEKNWNKIKANSKQMEALKQSREALLPKLISGEIVLSR